MRERGGCHGPDCLLAGGESLEFGLAFRVLANSVDNSTNIADLYARVTRSMYAE